MPLHRQFFLTFRIVRVLRHCLNKSCQGVVSPSFGPFGPCNVSRLLRDANRGL
jgi:hypothetical protein